MPTEWRPKYSLGQRVRVKDNPETHEAKVNGWAGKTGEVEKSPRTGFVTITLDRPFGKCITVKEDDLIPETPNPQGRG